MSWLTGWSYRMALTIAPSADGAQTAYQMKLLVGESAGSSGAQVHCDGSVLSSFDDLRFTTSDGVTLCPCWIEEITGSSPNRLAVVWIKIPSIAASPAPTIIYMYYGNAGASSTSSFDGTFIFGDTFESASLNTARWPSIDPGITYTIDAINKYLECTDNYTRGSIRLIHGKAINIGTGNFRIEAAYGAAGFGAYIGKIAANYVGRAYLFLGISGNDQTFTLYEIDAWDGTQVSQAFAATPAGNWNSGDHAEPATSYFIAHRVGMGANQTKVYVNGVNVVSGISTSNIISCHLGFFKSSVYSQLPERIYNFKIRNYTTNEPSWSEFGSEETTLSVYHVILSAVYSEESPEVNRVFVVGTDTAGGQVSGSAVTQAEVDLVGERMEAHHDPAIPSGMVAAAVAAAMLEKAGLDGHRAELVIPPHCGLELWDVLAVIDTVANQDALYRVIGYQFEYDTVKGIYLQRLKLCAV